MPLTEQKPSGAAERRPLLAWTAVFILFSPTVSALQARPIEVESPGKVLELTFELQHGSPTYRVSRLGRPVIDTSRLGLRLQGARSLDQDLKVASTDTASVDETWTQVWGEEKDIRNHYNQLTIDLEATTGGPRRLGITFASSMTVSVSDTTFRHSLGWTKSRSPMS